MLDWCSRLKEGGPDSARTWLIAAGGLILYFLCGGPSRANAVLFTALVDENPLMSRQDASWPFTVMGAVVIFAGPAAGILSYHLSCKTTITIGVFMATIGSAVCYFSKNVIFLTLFFGLIRGTGIVFCTVLLIAIINNNCVRTRSMVMAITLGGIPLGGFVFPTIVQYILETSGLDTTFLVLGALSLCAFVGPLIIMEQTPSGEKGPKDTAPKDVTNRKYSNIGQPISEQLEAGVREDQVRGEDKSSHDVEERASCSKDSESEPLLNDLNQSGNQKTGILKGLGELLRSPGFYLVMTTADFVNFVTTSYMLIIVDYAQDKGITPDDAVHMLTVNSIAELSGKLVLSWFVDKKYVSGRVLLVVILLVSGSSVLCLFFAQTLGQLLACSVVIGISQGVGSMTSSVLFVEHVKKENMHLAVTLASGLLGVMYLGLSPLVGLFRDNLGSYDELFLLLVGLLYAFGLLWIGHVIYKRRKSHLQSQKTN